MWIRKYRPEHVEEIAGNPQLAKTLKEYGWQKPVLLYGQTGIGKTALIEALAADLDLEAVEITEENIKSAKTISQTGSLFGKKKLLVIDNVDQIRGTKEVTELLKETKSPTIAVTSDYGSKKLATAKKICEKAQMRKPTARAVAKILGGICEKEDVSPNAGVLEKLAENADGDLRAAIIDLETVAKGREKITEEDLDVLDKRNKTGDIYKALGAVLAKKDMKEAITSLYDLEEQPSNILLWIDENMPHVYTDRGDIERAYENIAKADVFLGRIKRRQYWGFLRYASTLMSGGVNVSKKNKIRFGMYKFPSYLIKMSQTKKERGIKNSISEKLSPLLHASGRVIDKEYIPLLKVLLQKERISAEELAEGYRMEEEEIEYLSA